MNRIEQFIRKHPTVTCQYALAEICKPLLDLGIVYFSHVHIDKDFNMTTIGLCPDFFKAYFQAHYYQYDLHMAQHVERESCIVWDGVNRLSHSEAMHQTFTQFNQDHTFSLVRQTKKSKDCYHFAVKPNSHAINYRYFQLMEQLKLFINYFTDKVNQNKALKQAYDMPIRLNRKAGGYLTDIPLAENAHRHFFNTQQTERFYLNHLKYLTKREFECLHCLAQGHTATEIAVKLSITERTVKAHMKQIKSKLNCKTLFQLGIQYAELFKHYR